MDPSSFNDSVELPFPTPKRYEKKSPKKFISKTFPSKSKVIKSPKSNRTLQLRLKRFQTDQPSEDVKNSVQLRKPIPKDKRKTASVKPNPSSSSTSQTKIHYLNEALCLTSLEHAPLVLSFRVTTLSEFLTKKDIQSRRSDSSSQSLKGIFISNEIIHDKGFHILVNRIDWGRLVHEKLYPTILMKGDIPIKVFETPSTNLPVSSFELIFRQFHQLYLKSFLLYHAPSQFRYFCILPNIALRLQRISLIDYDDSKISMKDTQTTTDFGVLYKTESDILQLAPFSHFSKNTNISGIWLRNFKSLKDITIFNLIDTILSSADISQFFILSISQVPTLYNPSDIKFYLGDITINQPRYKVFHTLINIPSGLDFPQSPHRLISDPKFHLEYSGDISGLKEFPRNFSQAWENVYGVPLSESFSTTHSPSVQSSKNSPKVSMDTIPSSTSQLSQSIKSDDTVIKQQQRIIDLLEQQMQMMNLHLKTSTQTMTRNIVRMNEKTTFTTPKSLIRNSKLVEMATSPMIPDSPTPTPKFKGKNVQFVAESDFNDTLQVTQEKSVVYDQISINTSHNVSPHLVTPKAQKDSSGSLGKLHTPTLIAQSKLRHSILPEDSTFLPEFPRMNTLSSSSSQFIPPRPQFSLPSSRPVANEIAIQTDTPMSEKTKPKISKSTNIAMPAARKASSSKAREWINTKYQLPTIDENQESDDDDLMDLSFDSQQYLSKYGLDD